MIGMMAWLSPNYFILPVNHLQPLSEEDQMAEYRFKYKIDSYISSLILFRS